MRKTSKPPRIAAYWGNAVRDIFYFRDGTVTMPDGSELTAPQASARLLYHAFDVVKVHDGKTLLQVLAEQGFDLTTLKFEIRMKGKEK